MNTLGTYMDICNLTAEAAARANNVMYSEPEIRLAEELSSRDFIFEQQKRVKRGNTTAVLDFWVENMLAVEVDGKAFHKPVKDALRDSDLASEHGFRTMRVPACRVVYDVEGVVCRLALRLSQMGHQGFAASPVPLSEKEEKTA